MEGWGGGVGGQSSYYGGEGGSLVYQGGGSSGQAGGTSSNGVGNHSGVGSGRAPPGFTSHNSYHHQAYGHPPGFQPTGYSGAEYSGGEYSGGDYQGEYYAQGYYPQQQQVSSYDDYQPQQNQKPYVSQEQYIPTMVYQQTYGAPPAEANFSRGGGGNGRSGGGYRGSGSGTIPKQFQQPNHQKRVNNPFTKWKSQQYGNQQSRNGGNTGPSPSKLEGRKKLLAEAASILTSTEDNGKRWDNYNAKGSGGGGSRNCGSYHQGRWSQDESNSGYASRGFDSNRKYQPTNWRSKNNFKQDGGLANSDRSDNSNRPRGNNENNSRSSRAERSDRFNHRGHDNRQKQDSVCQRERLTDQLKNGTLECLVCCEKIRQLQPVWSCDNCYHVLHLTCTIKWASTSKSENGWRCPACQNVTPTVPSDYRCMCGKISDPTWVKGEVPHCCGDVCGKSKHCVHKCTLECHPGPCPACSAVVERACGCGRTSQSVQCSSSIEVLCDEVCSRVRNCGIHDCDRKCHVGPCGDCQEVIKQKCHCGSESREVPCTSEHAGSEVYSCGRPCGGKLSCGEHPCGLKCHSGPCPDCPMSPENIKTCPCGRTSLEAGARSSCLDPIPTCEGECGAKLKCGGNGGELHYCRASCHEGDCPPCPLTTEVICRCGFLRQDVPCSQLPPDPSDTRCQKRCSKRRSCGKHKCNVSCCIEVDHVCPLVCNKTLNCGRHKCQQLCHRGHCLPCGNASFEELHCECGAEVVLPPVPCGTRVPECRRPCPREHPCEHPPLHNCHSSPECPPCSVLTTKHCHAKHELRKTVPCHVKEYSCGRPCGRKLSGCGHSCIRICHPGPCLQEEESCVQPCKESRPSCGHPCGAPCHPGTPCPPTSPCQAQLKVTCQCGRRSSTRTCSENASDYRCIATSLLASKMADVQLGLSVDANINITSKINLKTLECNDECKLYERNLRLAIGLQIENPDLSNKLHPRYTDTMKAFAKKDPHFCQMVHDKLAQLVQLAKTSKQKSRAYSFDPMKQQKRQFVHEYCKHFGCESQAYDSEPKRNVIATAYKDRCWMPSYSLLEMIQRENGMRKVPLPSLKKDTLKDVQMKALQKSNSSSQVKQPDETKNSPPPSTIDYFDYTNS